MPAERAAAAVELWVWRHPRCAGAAGRCIGRTDLALDRRRAKRLARRIADTVRREGLAPRLVWTSPARRCADVGRLLKARWGYAHRIDARLAELDFGAWDGLPWSAIAPAEVARWEADFACHAPGGGEALVALLARLRDFLSEQPRAEPLLVVGHAGWISALGWLAREDLPTAAGWPRAIGHGALCRVRL